MSARRLVLPLAAVAVGLLAAPSVADAVTTPKTPAPLVATFPGGDGQTWRASLAELMSDSSAAKVVARPSPDQAVVETFGKVPGSTVPTACVRADVGAGLRPAVPGEEPQSVARALLPGATWEDDESWVEHGTLRNTAHDTRVAWLGLGRQDAPTSRVVAVGDWRHGTRPGWSIATGGVTTLAPKCDADAVYPSSWAQFIVRDAHPAPTVRAAVRRAAPRATVGRRTADGVPPLVAKARIPGTNRTATWTAGFGGMLRQYGGKTISRRAPNRITFYVTQEGDHAPGTPARLAQTRCERVDLSIRLLPAAGRTANDPVGVARRLRPKADFEQFLARGHHGAPMTGTSGDIRYALRRLGDYEEDPVVAATEVADWGGPGRGWRVATARSRILSWNDECIDDTPTADDWTRDVLYGAF